VISADGNSHASRNCLHLLASDLAPNQFGYFLLSQVQTLIAQPGASVGNLCVGSPFGRFRSQIGNSGLAGELAIDVDLFNVPQFGSIAAGDTWNFQAWFRDVGGTSNFTDALEILFP